MNVIALWNNIKRAKRLGVSVGDRLKYLFWLYDVPRRLGRSPQRPLTINFQLGEPIGEAQLSVRCNGGSDAFIFSEVFEHRYYDFDLPQPPKTILDLGSNAGLTALFLARKYPAAKLVCVEPVPDNVRLLRMNVAQNGVTAEIIAKAISTKDGSVTMQTSPNDYGHKVANMEFGRELDGKTFEASGVEMTTLMQQLGWGEIGLLKMDIEGYEGILLRENPEWLAKVIALCIECHEGFTAEDLRLLAGFYGFAPPQQLAGAWLMVRRQL